MANAPVRVLIVEDDSDDYLLTRELFAELGPGAYELERADSYESALAAIDRSAHDIYLVDYRLGSHTGLELLAAARHKGCTAPLIMLTGQQEREVDLSAMQAGADDFLLKDGLESTTLERTLRYALAQKRLQDEVRLNNLHLEQRVVERTAELNRLNEALQAEIAERKRAELALREADRRKDEFLATLAHELRNPLAPLTAAIQLIAAEPHRAEQVLQLGAMMQQQLDQLVRLIDDLVDVSRITSGKLRLRSEPTSLTDFITAALDQSRPLIEAARHTLDLRLPQHDVLVLGDKVRLAQIISNLLINAAKYTPAGGRIELHAARDQSFAEIAIRDNGIGIPPAMQARIFDLFAQVDSSSTRASGGLGIGLTIVRTLVEMHGGSIRAQSAGSGQGSTFSVRLPICDAPPATPANNVGASFPQASLPEHKILLVDDNQSAAHMMSRLLQKLGQQVFVAESGQSALAQVSEVVPDIIISDVAMPGMSGYDLAREVRRLQLPRRPFMVAVTGYGQDSDRREALAAGFDKHLTKPVGVTTLESLLRDPK